MKLPHRRKFLHLTVGAAALPVVSRVAWAQAYPTRPVRLVVGFAAGGSSDIMARLIGQWLSERLGQQFVIENRPGAGGNIGTEAVVNAAPDGYTLLLLSRTNASNVTLYENLKFNFIRDIAPASVPSGRTGYSSRRLRRRNGTRGGHGCCIASRCATWAALQTSPSSNPAGSNSTRRFRKSERRWRGSVYPPRRRSGRRRRPAALFNHLVGAQQNRWGYRKAERLGGLEVHGHLEFCRQLNGQLRRLRTA